MMMMIVMAVLTISSGTICVTEAFTNTLMNHHRPIVVDYQHDCQQKSQQHHQSIGRSSSSSTTSTSLVASFSTSGYRHLSTMLFLSDEPSDTSSDYYYDDNDDVIMTVESEDFSPTDAEVMVTSILDLIPSLVASASEEKRAQINEAILKLETLNPTSKPAVSPLLNGVWEL